MASHRRSTRGGFVHDHFMVKWDDLGRERHDTPCLVKAATAELRAGRIGLVEFHLRVARSEHFRLRTAR